MTDRSEYMKNYRAKNSQKIAQQIKRHRAENRLKCLLLNAKHGAKLRNIEFTITIDDIYIPSVCPVFKTSWAEVEEGRRPNSPSIDRIDNKLGYVPGNVWVISLRANLIKKDATLSELEALVAALKQKVAE